MDMNVPHSLAKQLSDLHKAITHQMGYMNAFFKAEGSNPVEMRTPSGQWIMADLLSAKAQVLSALANLSATNQCYYESTWFDEVGHIDICTTHGDMSRWDSKFGPNRPCKIIDPDPS